MGLGVILVDTSVWVEYLRDADDPSVERRATLIRDVTHLAEISPLELV